MRRQLAAGFALVLPLVLGFSSCMSGEKSDGLSRVDDLLSRVEQVQVEALVSREKASAAFDALGTVVAPDFKGDPMLVYADLVKKIDESKTQAKKLEQSVEPMKSTADEVFQAWTKDLEKFGNTNLRQQSQARLAETRSRYSEVHDAAVAALVSINAFNSDLSDQALFLEHDFNAAAVSVIAAQVPALTSQARDLGRRLNVCVNASKQYIASGALRGQLDAPAAPAAPAEKVATAPPARHLPNPISDTGNEAGVPEENAANTTTAPARRRPRAGANPTAPAAPANPIEAPEGQTGVQGSTQPTSLPVTPESNPAASAKPAPAKPGEGGNH